MPNIGMPKLNKKLRVIDGWSDVFDSIDIETSRSAPLTSVWEKYSYLYGGSGYFSANVTFADAECPDIPVISAFGGNGKGYTLTSKYTDGYGVCGDQYLIRQITGAHQIRISGIPDGAIVHHAIMMLKYDEVENYTGEESYLDTPSNFSFNNAANRFCIERIDINDSSKFKRFMTAFALPTGSMKTPASKRTPGCIFYGNTDVKDVVSENGDYYGHWRSAFTKGQLDLHSVRMGLRVWFK